MSRAETLFLVDDDAGVRCGLSRLLRSLGWHVEEFADGASFLDRLPYWGPACAIVDVAMPRMSGLELRDRIRRRAPSIAVILMTGEDRPPAAWLRDGVAVLSKPVEAEVLLAAVQRALQPGDGCSRWAPHLHVIA